MDIQIIISTAAGPQEVAKFIEALKGLGTPSNESVPVSAPTQPTPTTQPITATFAAPVTPQNPQPPTYITAGAPPREAPAQTPVAPPPAPVQQQYAAPTYYPPQAPVAASQPQQAPPPAPVPQQGAPTTPPVYKLEDLMRAGAEVASVSAANREKVLALIASFGAQAVNQIPEARYGEYAAGLRGLGARL